VQLFHDRTVPGPYTKPWREHWLRRVLGAQQGIRTDGPPEFRELRLITPEELAEIRRIWLHDKHEFDDSLPRIYEEVTGEPYARQEDDGSGLRAADWALLQEICGGDAALFDLQVALLGVERKYRGLSRRAGVFEALTERLRPGLYGSEAEAVADLQQRQERKKGWSLELIDPGAAAREETLPEPGKGPEE
jgi:DNA sulfur modification protein DndC